MSPSPLRGPAPRAPFAVRHGAIVAALLLMAACGDAVAPDAGGGEGPLAADAEIVLDRHAYSSAACAEVASHPGGDTAAGAARVLVVSTACYAVDIVIEDSLGARARALRARFAVHGRQDGDKDRGVPGYLAWDGLRDDGAPAPPGTYLWRMVFDFGLGRTQKYRALTDLRVP